MAIGFIGLVVLGVGLFWVTLPDVDYLARENPETTAFIELRREEAASAGKPFELQWEWRPLRRISRYLRHAVIHAEDARFFEHEGVDWEAIEKAAETNWDKRSLGIGGSTITQQLAKNLYLSPSRNPLRKLREYFIARRLEETLSKERILELYLNVAEWGDGVFGAEAAARHWFRTSAANLSPMQAARLAAALPNPRTRSPRVRNRALHRKIRRLLRAMSYDGLIPGERDEPRGEAAAEAAGAEPVGKEASDAPAAARTPAVEGDPVDQENTDAPEVAAPGVEAVGDEADADEADAPAP